MGSQHGPRNVEDYPLDQTVWIEVGGPHRGIKRVPARKMEVGPRYNEKLVPFSPYEHHRVIAIGTATAGQVQRILDTE